MNYRESFLSYLIVVNRLKGPPLRPLKVTCNVNIIFQFYSHNSSEQQFFKKFDVVVPFNFRLICLKLSVELEMENKKIIDDEICICLAKLNIL